MIFSVTYYLELHISMSFYYWYVVYEVKILMFYDAETTILTFVG